VSLVIRAPAHRLAETRWRPHAVAIQHVGDGASAETSAVCSLPPSALERPHRDDRGTAFTKVAGILFSAVIGRFSPWLLVHSSMAQK
jgi:hypothetical protein